MTRRCDRLPSDERGPRLYPDGLAPWSELTYPRYRKALRERALIPGIVLERPPRDGRPTAVCIHGWHGTPADFKSLGPQMQSAVNLAFFVYDEGARLAATAELLRDAIRVLPGARVLVAFSMGALLPAYAGATDPGADLRDLSALYLNPLLGGARYADADPLLALLDRIPALQWLHAIKRLFVRAFLPASIRDLDPRSRFQQAIFGPDARATTFRERTIVICTEDEASGCASVAEGRLPILFGCTRSELLERLGRVGVVSNDGARGHRAPLDQPSLVRPFLEAAIRDFL